VSTCRSCGAQILWAITANGRYLPVDADPDPSGSIRLHRSEGGDLLANVGGTDDGPLYRSHFASCPDADHHRR
jgi:hypothetical protein